MCIRDRNKEDIAKLEVRIAKTTVDLYDKINKEIDNSYENIDFEEEELEHIPLALLLVKRSETRVVIQTITKPLQRPMGKWSSPRMITG